MEFFLRIKKRFVIIINLPMLVSVFLSKHSTEYCKLDLTLTIKSTKITFSYVNKKEKKFSKKRN